MENEYIVLYEEGPWYVIEDKTVRDLEIVHTGETKTGVNIITEIGLLPNGDPIVVRAKYPKEEFRGETFKVILNTFYNWTNWKFKQLRELEKLKAMFKREEG